MKVKHLFYLTIFFALFTQCQNSEQGKSASSTEVKETSDTTALYTDDMKLSEEDKANVRDLINSIGPPLEISYIMQDLDMEFSTSSLTPYDVVSQYDNSFDKAALMGVFSADMVYCLIHNRSDMVKKYIESIQQLSADLNLSEVLDFDKLKELSEKKLDATKLAEEYTVQMEKVSNHLSKNNQLDVNALFAFGGWVESMYLASETGISLNDYSEEAIDLVHYETSMAESFIEIFNHFETIKERETMMNDLEKLRNLYSNFNVEESEKKIVVEQTEEMTQVIDGTTQKLELNNSKVDELVKQISKLRNGLINK